MPTLLDRSKYGGIFINGSDRCDREPHGVSAKLLEMRSVDTEEKRTSHENCSYKLKRRRS